LSLKILHISTVHPRLDSRIFYKECCSLVSAGFEVCLLVADGKGDEYREGVQIKDLGKMDGRLVRMLVAPIMALIWVLQKRPDLIHVHDPELLVVGLIPKILGTRVVYDAHEDLPEQIYRKHWIPRSLRKPISIVAKLALGLFLRGYDVVVTATDGIKDKVDHKRSVAVKNYPMLSEFRLIRSKPKEKSQFCYAGGITIERGAIAMIEALPEDDSRLALAGNFIPAYLPDQLKGLPNWNRVDHLGFLSRGEVAGLYAESIAGVVVLQGNQGFEETLPIKLFEYMAAGLPVICSDFPAWREIVQQADCGIIVDDGDSVSIRNAYQWMISNPTKASHMGQRGLEAVREKYSWDGEAAKLRSIYHEVLYQ
jgi:glycosyltransferase involved in cell wall biosynthesis